MDRSSSTSTSSAPVPSSVTVDFLRDQVLQLELENNELRTHCVAFETRSRHYKTLLKHITMRAFVKEMKFRRSLEQLYKNLLSSMELLCEDGEFYELFHNQTTELMGFLRSGKEKMEKWERWKKGRQLLGKKGSMPGSFAALAAAGSAAQYSPSSHGHLMELMSNLREVDTLMSSAAEVCVGTARHWRATAKSFFERNSELTNHVMKLEQQIKQNQMQQNSMANPLSSQNSVSQLSLASNPINSGGSGSASKRGGQPTLPRLPSDLRRGASGNTNTQPHQQRSPVLSSSPAVGSVSPSQVSPVPNVSTLSPNPSTSSLASSPSKPRLATNSTRPVGNQFVLVSSSKSSSTSSPLPPLLLSPRAPYDPARSRPLNVTINPALRPQQPLDRSQRLSNGPNSSPARPFVLKLV